MLPSMFNLEDRLAELRPTANDLRQTRELRAATEALGRSGRSLGDVVRQWLRGPQTPSARSRLAAH